MAYEYIQCRLSAPLKQSYEYRRTIQRTSAVGFVGSKNTICIHNNSYIRALGSLRKQIRLLILLGTRTIGKNAFDSDTDLNVYSNYRIYENSVGKRIHRVTQIIINYAACHRMNSM